MIAPDNRRREIPEVAAEVAREVKGARLKSEAAATLRNRHCRFSRVESAFAADSQNQQHRLVWQQSRRTAKIGCATNAELGVVAVERQSGDWRSQAAFARARLVGAFGFDVNELECGAGAVGFDSYRVLFFFGAGFQGDFVGLGFLVFAG